MSDSAPDLHMVNLVVNDMAASLGFYRRWGSQCLRVRTRLARTFS